MSRCLGSRYETVDDGSFVFHSRSIRVASRCNRVRFAVRHGARGSLALRPARGMLLAHLRHAFTCAPPARLASRALQASSWRHGLRRDGLPLHPPLRRTSFSSGRHCNKCSLFVLFLQWATNDLTRCLVWCAAQSSVIPEAPSGISWWKLSNRTSSTFAFEVLQSCEPQ